MTNHRLIFVSSDASSLAYPSTNSGPEPIQTLTVPLTHSLDGRFIQPWLSANYHLSTVVPVPGGGLEKLAGPTIPTVESSENSYTLKVVFNEGHGFEFYEALEEVKRVMFESEGQRPADLEELRKSPSPFLNLMIKGKQVCWYIPNFPRLT